MRLFVYKGQFPAQISNHPHYGASIARIRLSKNPSTSQPFPASSHPLIFFYLRARTVREADVIQLLPHRCEEIFSIERDDPRGGVGAKRMHPLES